MIDVPEVVDLRGGDETFSSLSRRLGTPFIVKGDRSVSGKHCFLIRSTEDYERAVLAVGRQLSTAWEFAAGPSVNFHFVCFSDGVAVFRPTSQILDDSDPLRPFRFGGSALGGTVVAGAESAVVAVKRLATHLDARGYRGVCGVDIILSRRGSLLVDLNPRFQGSSLLVSQDILLAGGPPLGEIHIAAVLGASVRFADEYSVDRATGREHASRQLFLRNSRSSDLHVVRTCTDGRYSWKAESLRWRAPFRPDDTLSEPDMVLLDLPAEGLRVAPGAPLGRVLLLGESRDPPTVGRLEAAVADMLTRR
ncbi:ATP-grasp domain-containing protein [Micromonospora chalcea]